MTLIEIMITISILGVLLAFAIPEFQGWIRNTNIRNAAENVSHGLSFARSESLKRNQLVRFQLVGSMANDCAQETTGQLWVVSHGRANGLCDLAENPTGSPLTTDFTVDPLILRKSRLEQQSTVTTTLAVTTTPAIAAQPEVCFTGLGLLARYDNTTGNCVTSIDTVTTARGDIVLNVTDPTVGTCQTAGGTLRCLRVVVNSGGQIRTCDPAVAAPDPRAC